MKSIVWCQIAIVGLIVGACANVVAPTGGKSDKTLPTIVATEPPQRALNAHPSYIALEFNKFVQQRSQVQQSIFLTPPIKTEYIWSGKTVYVNFKEPLDSNTTVALTLGTQYTDWDGNKPEAAYTLIFSTGSKLDSGTIRARVETDKPEGISAFLYQLTAREDTLNPATTKPKYKTQVGSNKTIEFPALAAGAYRLFVLRDEYRNDLLDKGTDAFGTAPQDILLPEGGTAEIVLRIAPLEDLVPPRIFEVRQTGATKLSVKFSEKIHPASLRASHFMLRDSLEVLPVSELPRVVAVHLDVNNPSFVQCYTDKALPTTTFPSRNTWQMKVESVRDSAGNTIADSLKTAFFAMLPDAPAADTLLPTLVRTQILTSSLPSPFTAPLLSDSAHNVPQKPRISFTFSQALAQSTTTSSIGGLVWESASGQAVKAAVALEQANRLVVEPLTSLAPNVWYTLGFRLQSLQALNGKALRDSVVLLYFQTEDARDYGGVSGTIADSVFTPSTRGTISVSTNTHVLGRSTDATVHFSTNAGTRMASVRSTSAQYVVMLEIVSPQNSLQGGNNAQASTPQSAQNQPNRPSSAPQAVLPFAPQRFEIRLQKAGAWEFANIPPGSYRLTAFVDANGNGRYDYGSAFPFVPAERFVVLPTELQVRPRWTIDNVRVVVP